MSPSVNCIAALAAACVLMAATGAMTAGPDLAANVKREGSRVYVRGIERLAWGQGKDKTFMGSMEVLAHYLGDKTITYDYLMGVSGEAFKIHKWAKGWCPSAGCAGPGFDTVSPTFGALGYKTEFHGWYEGKPTDETVKALKKHIVDSIDKGIPVQFSLYDDGLIAGYRTDGDKLLYRSYDDKAEDYTESADWPWCISVLIEKGKPLDRKAAVRGSLERALAAANTERFGDYVSGFAAYKDWSASLVDEPAFGKLGPKELGSVAHANAWCYHQLVDSRAAAVRYLRSIRSELGDASSPHLDRSADVYEQVVAKLRTATAPFSWDITSDKPWTSQMRRSQAAALRSAMMLERTAVDELRQALEAAN